MIPTDKKAPTRQVSSNQVKLVCTSKKCTWPSCQKEKTDDLTWFGLTRTLRPFPKPFLSQTNAPNIDKCRKVWCNYSWRRTGALCRTCLNQVYAIVHDNLKMYKGPGICEGEGTGCPQWTMYKLFCKTCLSQLVDIIDRLQQGKCTNRTDPNCDEYRKLHASDENDKATGKESGTKMSFCPCGLPVSREKSKLCSKGSQQK